jgi:hypothetical protein
MISEYGINWLISSVFLIRLNAPNTVVSFQSRMHEQRIGSFWVASLQADL